jgi:hypothetical protein
LAFPPSCSSMLPWASIPKRFSIDVRIAPRSFALGCSIDGCLCVPVHEARTRSGGRLLVLPHLSRCVGPSVAPRLDDRAALRCDIPRRVGALWMFPGADSATGSAYLLDFDHLAFGAGFCRRALCAGALRVDIALLSRWIPHFRGRHRSENPASSRASPKEHVHRGAERFRSRFLHQRPLPSGRGHLWAMALGFTQPLGHTRRVRLWDRAPPSTARASNPTGPSGEGFLATAGRFTRFPRRRSAVVHEIAGWQYEPR